MKTVTDAHSAAHGSRRRKRVASLAASAPCGELRTAAFVPMAGAGGQDAQTDLDARLASFIRYAQRSSGLVVVGVRVAFVAGQPQSLEGFRFKKLLKFAGRQAGLRCIEVRDARMPGKDAR